MLLQEEEGWEWLVEECSLNSYHLPMEVNTYVALTHKNMNYISMILQHLVTIV